MRCSGCGSNIPFTGQVCPRCQRDKSSDQAATIFGGAALFAGGWIGSLFGGVGGAIVGGLGFAFIVVLAFAASAKNSAKKPPVVRVEQPTVLRLARKAAPQPEATAVGETATRLRRLDQLKAQGVITDKEHHDLRQAIIRAV